ncbi:MAG: hypothetical protein R2816_09040 [Flavobacteriaceae bacterium]
MKIRINRHFKEWLVLASISVGIFLAGFAGVTGLAHGEVLTIGKERSKLVAKNIDLISDVYKYLSNQGHLKIEKVNEVNKLNKQIKKFEQQIDAQPKGESGRKERNRIYDEMEVDRNRLWNLTKETVQTYIQQTPNDKLPKLAIEYQSNLERINEIDNMGWKYSNSGRLTYTILGFLCNIVMVIGALCTLLFGFFGFMGFLGTIK